MTSDSDSKVQLLTVDDWADIINLVEKERPDLTVRFLSTLEAIKGGWR